MKRIIFVVLLVSLILAMGCRGKGGNADPGWDDPENYMNDPENYGDDPWAVEEGGEYDVPGDGAGGSEFYDVYAQGMKLMGMFKELKFSSRSTDPYSEHRYAASFSLVGDETVDGQKTRHFACTYYYDTDEKLEVWVNENCEPVQVLVDGALVTGSEVGPATNDLDYVLTQVGSDRFVGVRSEKELKERIETEWNIKKQSRETRDFGFGSIEVTRYELSTLIEPERFDTSRADNLVLEYARVGSKILFTKMVDETKWPDTGYESLEEITVERVIPY